MHKELIKIVAQSLIVGSNHAKFNFMAKTKYTCSYQLVFAISTVNFVIMCYFLKIEDQVQWIVNYIYTVT